MYNELIKKLRYCGNAISCLHCPYWEGCGGTKEDLTEAANAIERLQYFNSFWQEATKMAHENEPKWIPVTKRLPNEKEKVLVVCKNEKMFVAEHLSNTYCNDGWNVIGPLGSKRRIGNNRVTHWMPLPQKPKGE